MFIYLRLLFKLNKADNSILKVSRTYINNLIIIIKCFAISIPKLKVTVPYRYLCD